MKAASILVIAALVVGAGCIKKDGGVDTAAIEQQRLADDLLGDAGSDKLVDAASIVPKNYSFPDQKLLPSVQQVFTGTVSNDAMGGYEAERDEGGISYNTQKKMFDIGALLPPGQPAELVLRLIWDASEMNSADLDIVVDVPGTRTSYSPTSETFNWNLAVKTVVVNTVGVKGQPAQVGVEVASALINKGFDFRLETRVTYVKDVLTPYHAWALDVPQGASGLILESEKAGGDEHLTSQFIVIDPDDQLVQFVDFNDINIPTQSVFIPTSQPGTYVVYAYFMHGGFLRVKADVPLENLNARTLSLVETSVADSTTPSPGYAGKDYFNGSAAAGAIPKDDVGATSVNFAPEGPFPLKVTPYVKGQVTTMAKITLKTSLGTVAQRVIDARYEDERGTLGYTSDHEGTVDHWYDWSKIEKGTWKAEIVNDNANVELGHVVLTYAR